LDSIPTAFGSSFSLIKESDCGSLQNKLEVLGVKTNEKGLVRWQRKANPGFMLYVSPVVELKM